MKPALIDTDILLLFFRGDALITSQFKHYLQIYHCLNISLITVYEIYYQLEEQNEQQRAKEFLKFVSYNQVIPLTPESINLSANIYQTLSPSTRQVSDLDLLVAGVAIAHNLALITHQRQRYQGIQSLVIEDWHL